MRTHVGLYIESPWVSRCYNVLTAERYCSKNVRQAALICAGTTIKQTRAPAGLPECNRQASSAWPASSAKQEPVSTLQMRAVPSSGYFMPWGCSLFGFLRNPKRKSQFAFCTGFLDVKTPRTPPHARRRRLTPKTKTKKRNT